MTANTFAVFFDPRKQAKINDRCLLLVFSKSSQELIFSRIFDSGEKRYLRLPGKKYSNDYVYCFSTDLAERKRTPKDPQNSNALPVCSRTISQDLAALNPLKNNSPRINILREAEDGERAYLTRNMLSAFYHQLLLDPSRESQVKYSKFLNSFPADLISTKYDVGYFHGLCSVLTAYISTAVGSSGLETTAYLRKFKDEYLQRWAPQNVDGGAYDGATIATGHLLSKADRTQATECYRQVLAKRDPNLELFLHVDGLTTYFDEPPQSENPTIEQLIESPRRNTFDTNICIGADISYWHMYAAQWAHYSELFPSLNFEFVIVDDDRVQTVKAANSFIEAKDAIAELMAKPYRANNCSISRIYSPEATKTFYACVRFFLAELLLTEGRGDVLSLDIDQYLIGDLNKFIKVARPKVAQVSCPIVGHYFNMLPGRSHLAGYVYMTQSLEAISFVRDINRYVTAGLNVEKSWMLDQNAIRFAAEHTNVENLNMHQYQAFTHSNDLRITAKNRINSLN